MAGYLPADDAAPQQPNRRIMPQLMKQRGKKSSHNPPKWKQQQEDGGKKIKILMNPNSFQHIRRPIEKYP